MRNLFSVLPFVALSFFCWGIYGPILHEGQYAMGADGVPSSLRPLICVGIAYFIIAVLFPIGILKTKWGKGKLDHHRFHLVVRGRYSRRYRGTWNRSRF